MISLIPRSVTWGLLELSDQWWHLRISCNVVLPVSYHETTEADVVSCQISDYLWVSLLLLVRHHDIVRPWWGSLWDFRICCNNVPTACLLVTKSTFRNIMRPHCSRSDSSDHRCPPGDLFFKTCRTFPPVLLVFEQEDYFLWCVGHYDSFWGATLLWVVVYWGCRTDALCLRVVYRGSSMFLGCSWWCIMSPGGFLACSWDTWHFRTLPGVVSRCLVVALRLFVGCHDSFVILLWFFCGSLCGCFEIYFGVCTIVLVVAGVISEISRFHGSYGSVFVVFVDRLLVLWCCI